MADFLASVYLWIKALHLLAIIAWMAGMMYLPRLFVYHHQAEKGGEAEAMFLKMERRLLKGIMNPSVVAVWALGLSMLYAAPSTLSSGWFHVKLACVVAMSGIHGFYAATVRRFAAGERPRTEKFWRVINEAPFILLIAVAFMAVVKPF